MRQSVQIGSLIAVLFAAAPAWAGPASDFIDAHPRLAYSIRRQISLAPFEVPESSKVAWPDWSAEQKQQLEDAYQQALTWLHSSSPLTDLADESGFTYPPPNLCGAGSNDDYSQPWTCVDVTWAWDLYLRWIAQNLALEIEGKLPWSILDYDTDMLKALFDSSSIMTLTRDMTIGRDYINIGTGSPGHFYYVKRSANLGGSLIAPPRYTYKFLAANNLIGTSRQETIVKLLGWARDNLWHFTGSSNYSNYESIWHYRGLPPITRIIEGTDSPDGFGHWTAGCYGTTGFLRNVLRAVNIPVELVRTCSHFQAYFMSEHLYMDHGDDPYNLDFKQSQKSPLELLIPEETFNIWFHDSRPNNQDEEILCASDGTARSYIGRMPNILNNKAERCGDGIDNDGDGLVDCADTDDCPPLSVAYRTKVVASDFATEARFGTSADLNGRRAIVGAQTDPERGNKAGAAYVFEYDSGKGWVQHGKLIGSDAIPGDFGGFAVSIDGDLAVSTSDDHDGFRGAAYVFARDSQGAWTQQAQLTSFDSAPGDRFGVAVALRGGTLAVGAMGTNSEAGSIYVFDGSGATWTQTAKLAAADPVSDAHLGYDVALSGDTIAAGAYGSSKTGVAGSAYVFRRFGGTWEQEAKLVPSVSTDLDFGWSLALDGDLLVVGAPAVAGASGPGAVYVFRRSGSNWKEEARLLAGDGVNLDGFGYNVGVSGETITVGSYHDELATGAVYVFRKMNGLWMEQQKIVAWDAVPGSWFGAQVPLAGDMLLATAYGDDAAAPLTGAAYFYGLGNTYVGQCLSVTVSPTSGGAAPVTLGFASVAGPGSTTVSVSSQGPAVPSGFQLGTPATYYEIATTADYQGLIRVCIDYSKVSYNSETSLTMLHYENGGWVDVCAGATGCTRYTNSHVICGVVASLSPFVVVERSLLPLTAMAAGYATTSAYFLSQELGPVGNMMTLDVYLASSQPDPHGLGQVQLTATVESQGIWGMDLGTWQLAGLKPGAWNTLSFEVPSALQRVLLNSAAAGHFTVVTNTPTNAQPLLIDNLRFGGAMTARPVGAPTRGSLASLLSFESAGDWSASGATLSGDGTQRTDGGASLRIVQNGSYSVLQSADFLTRELSTIQAEVGIDVELTRRVDWGALQLMVDCASGQIYWIGQADLTTMTSSGWNHVTMALPPSVQSALAQNQACRVRVTVSADAGELHLDNLRL